MITTSLQMALAPTGKLRVGVYPGSPTSLVRGPSGEARGVTVDLGRALAERLTALLDPKACQACQNDDGGECRAKSAPGYSI